jgi:maleate isomerase
MQYLGESPEKRDGWGGRRLVTSSEPPRARIGTVIPLDPDETVERSEAELFKLVPSNAILDVGFQQVPVADDGSQLPINIDYVRGVGADPQLGLLAKELVMRGAAAVGYACTSASFVGGPGWAVEHAQRIADSCGAPATNTSLSAIEALRKLGVSKLGVATPYVTELNERLVSFLNHYGIEVLSLEMLGLETNHSTTPTERIVSSARRSAVVGAQAVFIACTGQKVANEIEALEAQLGMPVVTANQVTLWHTARLAGLSGGRGLGRLYDAMEP